MTMVAKVIEFNQEVVRIAPRTPAILGSNEAKWLYNVLIEEANELHVASRNRDLVGCVDALIDSIYFAIGGLYRHGLTEAEILEIFSIVHEANMAKHPGTKNREVKHHLDAVKPKGWVSPEDQIQQVLRRRTTKPN